MLTYGSATRGGGGWDSGDCLRPPLLARSQKHLFRLYIVPYTDICARILVYCNFLKKKIYRQHLFKDLSILWVYLERVVAGKIFFRNIDIHIQIHMQVFLFTTQRWSFPSPCGRTCAFCRYSWKFREILMVFPLPPLWQDLCILWG
jgi:hypothetical protein